ncbi:hypothetical protein JHK82_016293 [Glycine max]|nr:hypothetical protein JHK82_016293 [Glycine max]
MDIKKSHPPELRVACGLLSEHCELGLVPICCRDLQVFSKEDIKFGVDNDVDFFVVSFFKDARVVHELNHYLKSNILAFNKEEEEGICYFDHADDAYHTTTLTALVAVVIDHIFSTFKTLNTTSDGKIHHSTPQWIELKAELAVSDFSGNGDGILSAATTVASTFLLDFVVEWGDKSFFSTIALPPASSPLRVIAGVVASHGVATLLPVLGGSLLGMYLPEKKSTISAFGGMVHKVADLRLTMWKPPNEIALNAEEQELQRCEEGVGGRRWPKIRRSHGRKNMSHCGRERSHHGSCRHGWE